MRRTLVLSFVALLVPFATAWSQMVELPGSPIPATNYALGGTATQSSTAFGRGPEKAVDGSLGEPGTHTDSNDLTDPTWWQVVLNGGDQDIAEVVLYNRVNCCQLRMRDITVTIRDAADTTDLLVSPVLNPADVLGGPPTLEWDVMAANGGSLLSGGIVRVARAWDPSLLPNADDQSVLTLNEVRVLADDAVPGVMVRDTNVALGGLATQSSVSSGGVPERAIDGNNSGVWGEGSTTHTNAEENPWWLVELNALSEIDGISIYNRTDCCGDRLSDIVVDVLAADGSTVVATSGVLNPNNDLFGPAILAVDLTGQGVEGRFVRVTRMGADAILSMAEVEVYGAVIPEPTSFLLLVMAAIGLCIRRTR